MNVKTVVELTADSIYLGWRGLEVTDKDGNEVNIKLSKEQIASLAENATSRAKEDRRKLIEELREELEELESDPC